MARLRHSVSGGQSRCFVGDPAPGRRVGVDGSQLVTVEEFHRECLRELKKIKMAWEGLDYGLVRGALVLLPTPPSVPPMIRPVGRAVGDV